MLLEREIATVFASPVERAPDGTPLLEIRPEPLVSADVAIYEDQDNIPGSLLVVYDKSILQRIVFQPHCSGVLNISVQNSCKYPRLDTTFHPVLQELHSID